MESSLLFSLRLSLQVAAVATAFVTVIGVSIAYFLAVDRFRGKEFLDVLLTLPLVLPPTVTGYYLIVLFGRNGLVGGPVYDRTGWSIMFTWHAAVLASFVVALPLMIKTTRAAMESVDNSLVNASYTLGRNRWETALRVILPLSRKGITAGAVLSFARAMGEFGATLMVAGNIPGKTNTMPLSIYSLVNSGDWSEANTLVILLTALSGLFLYTANKFSQRAI
jgi:molybdate transport system permease protein